LQKVQIRRNRASGLSWALALLIAALVFYIATLAVTWNRPKAQPTAGQTGRKIRTETEITLKGGEAWLVTFGVFDNAESARLQAGRHINRGSAGYVYEGDAFCSVGNAYKAESEALSAAKRISAGGIHAETTKISQKDARIRLTAADDEKEAFLSAYQALIYAEDALFEISDLLDGGADMDNAKSRIAIAVHELEPHTKNIESASAKSTDPICTGLRKLSLSALSDLRALTQGRANSMYLSSAVKHAAIDMKIRRFSYLSSIS